MQFSNGHSLNIFSSFNTMSDVALAECLFMNITLILLKSGCLKTLLDTYSHRIHTHVQLFCNFSDSNNFSEPPDPLNFCNEWMARSFFEVSIPTFYCMNLKILEPHFSSKKLSPISSISNNNFLFLSFESHIKAVFSYVL